MGVAACDRPTTVHNTGANIKLTPVVCTSPPDKHPRRYGKSQGYSGIDQHVDQSTNCSSILQISSWEQLTTVMASWVQRENYEGR